MQISFRNIVLTTLRQMCTHVCKQTETVTINASASFVLRILTKPILAVRDVIFRLKPCGSVH